MSRIVLQPSGNRDARDHYVDTIENEVSLERIKPHISDDNFKILNSIYPNGSCKVWGVTDGGSNLTKWKRIDSGDVTLFARQGYIYASAVTTFKLHSRSLAASLWDYNSKGQTWEYIYFLDEVKSHKISYLEFNQAVGYANNFIIQGFSVLDREKSAKVLKTFDLYSDTYFELIEEEDYENIVEKLQKLESTEIETISTRRLEQGYLKTILFGNHSLGNCACCKKKLPISLLVTAHIKKRAYCSLDERLDKNIVMPMCKLGCDEIYEKGYISVLNGKFIELKPSPITSDLKNFIYSVIGNSCDYFNNRTEKYFKWHRDFHLK